LTIIREMNKVFFLVKFRLHKEVLVNPFTELGQILMMLYKVGALGVVVKGVGQHGE
jgi:hypothetical protein